MRASTLSNVSGQDTVVMLPIDPGDPPPDPKRRPRPQRSAPAIVIADSFGRAWRHGQVDITIGCAGLDPLEDWRGRVDSDGRELHATWIAVADELAAAADLARRKDG